MTGDDWAPARRYAPIMAFLAVLGIAAWAKALHLLGGMS